MRELHKKQNGFACFVTVCKCLNCLFSCTIGCVLQGDNALSLLNYISCLSRRGMLVNITTFGDLYFVASVLEAAMSCRKCK